MASSSAPALPLLPLVLLLWTGVGRVGAVSRKVTVYASAQGCTGASAVYGVDKSCQYNTVQSNTPWTGKCLKNGGASLTFYTNMVSECRGGIITAVLKGRLGSVATNSVTMGFCCFPFLLLHCLLLGRRSPSVCRNRVHYFF